MTNVEKEILKAFDRHGMITFNAAATAVMPSTESGSLERHKPAITSAWRRLHEVGLIRRVGKHTPLSQAIPKHERPLD